MPATVIKMTNLNELIQYAKAFSGLTSDLEACLKEIAPEITPHLKTVTNSFYNSLGEIPGAAKYLNGRIDKLKDTHLNWLNGLFTMTIDAEFAHRMYKVGETHFKISLPVEFMVGSMALLNNEFTLLVFNIFGNDPIKCAKILRAINAVSTLSLMLMLMKMEQCYRESTIAEELERFLNISGMSRTLFTNLANAYN